MLQKLDPGSYYGISSELHENGGLSVAETRFPHELAIPAHEHVNSFFCFVLQGRGTRIWPGKAGAEQPMSLTVFPQDLPHANRWYGRDGHVLHVEFSKAWLEPLRGSTTVLDRPADFSRGSPVWLAHRVANECRNQDDVSPLAIEGLVLELLAECSRERITSHSSRVPRWLTLARRRLEDRFSEKFSLTEIADACGVSPDYLSRSFRRNFGCTVGEEIRRIRIDYACRRLTESNLSLSDIALESGFTDQSHFTKVFRRYMRMAPREFRSLHQGGRSRTNWRR